MLSWLRPRTSVSEEVEDQAVDANAKAAVLAEAVRHDLQWIPVAVGTSLFHEGLLVVKEQLEAKLAKLKALT